eukprot:CAMPEP_0184301696 /NCGR_PEP_ID=MMETSP1049-20130417/11837_1 /TAXON_ID=77928 /ORGANISM="Proteomonas sulcata, Strain CCMP704" /LENGTH=89 /DNA_ID=CAMNT_0026612769 /DNA_START=2302 /DNA_END=2571 /DNA_ORIENTATION=-
MGVVRHGHLQAVGTDVAPLDAAGSSNRCGEDCRIPPVFVRTAPNNHPHAHQVYVRECNREIVTSSTKVVRAMQLGRAERSIGVSLTIVA